MNFNAELAAKCAANTAETLETDIIKNVNSLVEMFEEAAKQSNMPVLLSTAKKAREEVDALIPMVKKLIGTPGDTMNTVATFHGYDHAAKLIMKNFGGEA